MTAMLGTANSTLTLRQRACMAGPDPAYWYAVEWDAALKPENVIDVQLWDTAVAVFRGRNGRISAIENRCAHRQVKLSHGFVEDCRLKCTYHGWTYGPDGRLVDIPHDRFGKPFPSVQLRTFPVEVRYGLIWVFFGDPALANRKQIPKIPELEGNKPWACVEKDYILKAHPTMIVNNAMDSTHVATLHGRSFRTRSLKLGPLTRCQAEDDRVMISHQVTMDSNALLWYIANRIKDGTQNTCYDYPNIWSTVGGVYWLWYFLLPVDKRTTRIFILSLSERVKIPFTPWLSPQWLNRALLPLGKRLLVNPLLDEDVWSTEIEQEGFDKHSDMPSIDFHPASHLGYQLTIRKWEEHLARDGGAQA